MDMRKRLKGGDVDWKHLEIGTKEMRAISEAKMRDLIKMLPLVSPESREYLEKFVDLPTNDFLDDIDGFDDIDEEYYEPI